MKFVWEKCKAYHQTIFITTFNKYQGISFIFNATCNLL